MDYIGRHYKRGAAQPGDYLTLAPGQSLTRTVDLARAYDLSVTGTYALRYELDGSHGGEGPLSALRSSDVSVWVEGRPSGDPELRAQGTVSAMGLRHLLGLLQRPDVLQQLAELPHQHPAGEHRPLQDVVRLLHQHQLEHGQDALLQNQDRLRHRVRGGLQLQ